ncbi:nif-specific transcriptional activator NifA [Rhizobium leguminosarum]|uniref:Nif-specific regulatory protein n=1 Tax=Rhizobium leguminosarum TaxID=384 RepID=A0A7K3VRP9_RHILE|nr:nif-specific transcriptional activator NifA [Rhizobium leguminosarum]MBY2950758.1 nif-specific transcriptional activator NifA [Rhizobium leguminosarum]NEK19564.1 nif-specific transcriptional activator NifA [Rhizobium leguminosarum]
MTKTDERIRLLSEIASDLIPFSPLEIALKVVMNTLDRHLPMREGVIVIYGAGREPRLTVWHAEGQDVRSRSLTVEQSDAIDCAFASGEPHFVKKTVALGLKVKGEAIGALWIDRTFQGSAVAGETALMKHIANLIAKAIHRELCSGGGSESDEPQAGQIPKIKPMRHSAQPDKIDWIVGESPALKRVLTTTKIVAATNSAVLLRGESGTGKECFARAIHALSIRKSKAFIKLNCAALSETVLESELFGHEKGAYTGALFQRAGRFELANGGTLLLDEIGDVSPQFQAKLLRVLQEGEFERLGGTKTLKVDVRVICATNKNLEVAVLRGEFRADLYYRINVVPIVLPPLRQRDGDISLLAQVFLEQFNKANDRNFDFAPSAIDILSKCAFPGNVRELDNCVQRTATLASSNTIASSDFACQQGQCSSALLWKDARDGLDNDAVHSLNQQDTMLSGLGPYAGAPSGATATMEAPGLTERDRLINAMVKAGWVQAKAARILGKTPRQVGYALRRFRIDVKKE